MDIEGKYFDRHIEKVDYLDDLKETIEAIKRLTGDMDRKMRLTLSRIDEKKENYTFFRKYESVDEMEAEFSEEEFMKVGNIDILIMRKDKTAKSIHLHRDTKTVVVLEEKSSDNY